MDKIEPFLPYIGLFLAGFVGALTRGVAWKPTTALVQELGAIILICLLVNYLGDKITFKGQAAAIGTCCFLGAQKMIGILANQIPLIRNLTNAKT